MKNSSSFVCRIIYSAFFVFIIAQCAVAQENNTSPLPPSNGELTTATTENWYDEDVYIAQLKRDHIPDGVIKTMVAKRRQQILAGRKIVPVKEPVKLFGQNPAVQALC